MQNFIIAKATDVGQTRQVNEDSMTVFESVNGHVMVVCDGMGGQAAGDQASQLAVSIIESILTDNQFNSPEEAIRSSIMAANQGILNRQAQNPELDGMGSTCVMLIIKDGKVHCGWVGDSRIYYISNHTIRQISKDQSYVQQLVDAGQLTPEQAEHHPQKNEITNALGIPNMTAPEVIPVPITPEPGSVFLLCSDGLSGMVDNASIERLVSKQDLTLQQKANQLVQMANDNGGLDNVTVELVQFGNNAGGATSGSIAAAAEGSAKTAGNKGMNTMTKAIAGLVFLAAIGAGVYFAFSGGDSTPSAEKQKPAPAAPAQPAPAPAAPQQQTAQPAAPAPTTNTTTVTVKKENNKPAPSKQTSQQQKSINDIKKSGEKTGDGNTQKGSGTTAKKVFEQNVGTKELTDEEAKKLR